MEHSHNEIQHGLARPRKRRKRWQRETWTCAACRTSHRKCNGERPCKSCKKSSRPCVDPSDESDGNVRMEANRQMQSHKERGHGQARPRKRRKRWQRETSTCSLCRLFHRKCNGKRPCDQCSKF